MEKQYPAMIKFNKNNSIVDYILRNLKLIFYSYIAIIMYLSFAPVSYVGSDSDKVNHILAFIVFAVLFEFTYRLNKILFCVAAGLVFGVFIEFVQYFLPYRSCDFFDVLADISGILIGFFIVIYLKKFV